MREPRLTGNSNILWRRQESALYLHEIRSDSSKRTDSVAAPTGKGTQLTLVTEEIIRSRC